MALPKEIYLHLNAVDNKPNKTKQHFTKFLPAVVNTGKTTVDLKAWIQSNITSGAISITGGVEYKGAYNATTNVPDLDTAPVGVLQGDMYTVTAAGSAFFTVVLEVGDVLIAESDNPTLVTDWTIVQANLVAASTTVAGYVELATTTEVTTGTDATRAITPDALTGSSIDLLQVTLTGAAGGIATLSTPGGAVTTPNLVMGVGSGGVIAAGGLDNVVIGNDSALALTTGDDNIIIGSSAGLLLDTGATNVMIGLTAGDVATTAANSVFIGNNAGGGVTTAAGTTAIGSGAGASGAALTGASNVMIGVSAGGILTGASTENVLIGTGAGGGGGDRNVAIGAYAGDVLATGAYGNVSVGYRAGNAISTGGANVAIGADAGSGITTGSCNIAVGNEALYKGSTTGNYNVVIGKSAGTYMTGAATNNILVGAYAGYTGTTATDNTIMGYKTGYYNDTGSHNFISGNKAAYYLTSGSYNTVIGYKAGYSLATNDKNVFIGYQAGYSETTASKLYIADSSAATPLIYGDFAAARLKVNGTLEVSNVAEGGTGALQITTAREQHTLAAAADSATTTLAIPVGSLIIGASFNVNTAITTSGAGNTWDADFITGDTTNIVAAGAAGAQDTKADALFVPILTTGGACEVEFDAPGAETFTAGVIEVVVYYIDLTSLASV